MERKAWENLDAARKLLDLEDPCPNAAASRAYYAAYQACWVAMGEKGIEPLDVRPGVRYFKHAELPHQAYDAGVLDEPATKVLDELQEMRVTADYYEEDLSRNQVTDLVQKSEVFVRALLGEEPKW